MALVNFIFGIHKNRHTLWARLFPGAEQFLQEQRKGERSVTQCSVNEDWGPQAEGKRECKYVISMFVLGAKATNRMEDTVGWAVLAQPHRTTFLPSSPFPEEWVSTGHSRHWTDSPSGTCGYRNPSVNLPCVRLSSWTWLVHIKEILKHSSRKISPLPVNRSIRHRSTCNMDSSFALFFFPSPAQDAYGTVTTTDCERNSDLHTNRAPDTGKSPRAHETKAALPPPSLKPWGHQQAEIIQKTKRWRDDFLKRGQSQNTEHLNHNSPLPRNPRGTSGLILCFLQTGTYFPFLNRWYWKRTH